MLELEARVMMYKPSAIIILVLLSFRPCLALN